MRSYKEEVEEKLSEAIKVALDGCGKIAEGNAKQLCPVDTGRLRNSITYGITGGGKSVRIGTNVEYAKFVEFDDRKHHAVGQSHYLRDGIINSIPSCNDLISSINID